MAVRPDDDVPASVGGVGLGADERLSAALSSASSTQIGSLGEETAAVLLESACDAVIIAMGDAALPRRGADQDLDLVVMIDGEPIAYEVKTSYHSRKSFALTRAGNLPTPRLRRARADGEARQGSQPYVAVRMDDIVDTGEGYAGIEVRVMAVNLRLMMAQEFDVDDVGRGLRMRAAPVYCRTAAHVAFERIIGHRGRL